MHARARIWAGWGGGQDRVPHGSGEEAFDLSCRGKPTAIVEGKTGDR